jgi:UDP-GlcNAc:undecaprenyl-phosphate GlcNAc-1-phosphate transferase
MVLGVVTAALTGALCPAAIALMRARGALSLPEERSLHSRPTPRGGGLAPAAAALVIAAVVGGLAGLGSSALGLLLAAAGFAAVGLAEDLRGVPPLRRFGLQLAVALAAAFLLAPGAAVTLVVALWLVTYANAFNFMDGINGISALSVVVTCAAWAVAGTQSGSTVLVAGSAVLAGAALGFLPFNAPIARVFLGDVGSYFFGAAVGALAVVASVVGVPPLAVLGPLLVPLTDTGLTLARRVLAGEPWHLPHKTHAYQRLVTGGWSHLRTSSVVAGLSAVCAGFGLVGGTLAGAAMLALAVTYVLVLPRLVSPRPRPRLQATARRAA